MILLTLAVFAISLPVVVVAKVNLTKSINHLVLSTAPMLYKNDFYVTSSLSSSWYQLLTTPSTFTVVSMTRESISSLANNTTNTTSSALNNNSNNNSFIPMRLILTITHLLLVSLGIFTFIKFKNLKSSHPR